MYSEPAKFVSKLRELKRDDNLLLFKCEVGAGHNSKSGRYIVKDMNPSPSVLVLVF